MFRAMNSLNIVSRLAATTPPPSPPRSRTGSAAHAQPLHQSVAQAPYEASLLDFAAVSEKLSDASPYETAHDDGRAAHPSSSDVDEKAPLLEVRDSDPPKPARQTRVWQITKRIADAVLYGATVVFTTVAAPGRYVIACFYDDEGRFSAILPLRSFRSLLSRRRRKSTAQAVGLNHAPDTTLAEEKPRLQPRPTQKRLPSVDRNASAVTKDEETEPGNGDEGPARNTRSRTAAAQQSEDGPQHQRRSRATLSKNNDEGSQKRKAQKAAHKKQQAVNPEDVAAVASTLKSPSSPSVSGKSRYPRSPAPPRPLVPRRHPSYTLSHSLHPTPKTLIIDLDETLVHSMAKGGRMSTGHMVEVRLGGPVNSAGVSLGPGVPILYYVHERPGCHEFLRKVAKWYRLVIFTASVQEYADPVIDWLERERRYFHGRYYRQHCTLRNGAYIKDLAQVEPNLSKVMILDNSPMSYIFHEDNAIPIEGWISDPTDNDLLHLIPLLEGLQHVTDVRALLALRQGQAQAA